jgi:hypothetical protein
MTKVLVNKEKVQAFFNLKATWKSFLAILMMGLKKDLSQCTNLLEVQKKELDGWWTTLLKINHLIFTNMSSKNLCST